MMNRPNTNQSFIDNNCHFSSRCEIVEYLYKVTDYYREDRELVQVAMSYIDRYVARMGGMNTISGIAVNNTRINNTSIFSPCIAKHIRRRKSSPKTVLLDFDHDYDDTATCSSTDSNSSVTSTTSVTTIQTTTSIGTDNHNEYDNDNDPTQNLGIIVLCCLDLAMKLYSPLSGNIQRATFVEIMDAASTKYHRNHNASSSTTTATTTTMSHQDYISQVLHSLSYQDIQKRLSTKFNCENFETIRQLAMSNNNNDNSNPQQKEYQRQDYANVQSKIIKKLDYYLHPKTPTFFVNYYLQEMIDWNTNNNNTFGLDWNHYFTLSSSLEQDYTTFSTSTVLNQQSMDALSTIRNNANMQIELSLFYMSLLGNKFHYRNDTNFCFYPSIIAFSALQNAIIEYFHTSWIENNNYNNNSDSIQNNENDHKDQNGNHIISYGKIEGKHDNDNNDWTTIMKSKIHWIHFIIGRPLLKHYQKNIMGNNIDKYYHEYDCKDFWNLNVTNVMKVLFHHWKRNNPDIVTFDESIISSSCIANTATLFADMEVDENNNSEMGNFWRVLFGEMKYQPQFLENVFVPIDIHHHHPTDDEGGNSINGNKLEDVNRVSQSNAASTYESNSKFVSGSFVINGNTSINHTKGCAFVKNSQRGGLDGKSDLIGKKRSAFHCTSSTSTSTIQQESVSLIHPQKRHRASSSPTEKMALEKKFVFTSHGVRKFEDTTV